MITTKNVLELIEDEDSWDGQKIEESNVLIHLIDDMWVEELLYEGGSAEILNYDGLLEEAVLELCDFKETGWYYISGLDIKYSIDTYGEIDVNWWIKDYRKATEKDKKEFYF